MANQANVVQNDIARAIYLVDANGNPITTLNPLGVNASFSASSIAINDPVTTTNKATVDGSGNLHVAIAGALAAGTNNIGAVTVSQADLTVTGVISAAQPVIGTPVASATVVLAVAQGQSTWKALLLAGGGGFTSGTNIVADKSLDGGTTWGTASFKVSNASPATTQTSVVGPGPLELTGNAAGVSHVRIRCSVLNSTETVAVTIRGGAGIGDVGLISSIPAGANLIGYVEDIEQSGYVAATSPPTQTNAGSDTSYTFSSQINRVIIQNNTSANVNYAFDATATAGSLALVPSAMLVYPKKCTVLHLFTAAAQNINGTTAANIVVLGAL